MHHIHVSCRSEDAKHDTLDIITFKTMYTHHLELILGIREVTCPRPSHNPKEASSVKEEVAQNTSSGSFTMIGACAAFRNVRVVVAGHSHTDS